VIVDLFAGGGGASTGIEWALGRSPDVAINHNPKALAMHVANHPLTQHLCGDVWHYAPRDVTQGQPVELLHASPTCTHFSKAKGGALRDAKIRSLAWVVVRWAKEARPRIITLENVEEFAGWGRLDAEGKPVPSRKGETFRRWVRALEKLGYRVEWKELRACDFGAPTTRKRLFLVARCDGERITWPTPTHGPGRAHPYRSAAECIDWSLPCPSIFGREKPLAEATLRRIARGVRKFVLDAASPFLIPVSHSGDARVYSVDDPLRTVTSSSRSPFALISPSLIHQSNGERPGQAPRIYDITEPLRTVVAGGVKQAVVAAFLEKAFGGERQSAGLDVRSPLGTVTTVDHHRLVEVTLGDRREEVRAFLTKFYGTSTGQDLQLPLGTVTSGGWKHGLVMVQGEPYAIADIGMRMLTPRELFRAQGFPDSYAIDPACDGKRLSKTDQISMCGNSVAPHVEAAILRANFREALAECA
jgi:DNA (cytosine-5)-methyltransferase 1